MIELRLADPAVDFWVDVRVRRVGSDWLAVADLAGTPELVVARRLDLAIILALWPLGPELARLLASAVEPSP